MRSCLRVPAPRRRDCREGKFRARTRRTRGPWYNTLTRPQNKCCTKSEAMKSSKLSRCSNSSAVCAREPYLLLYARIGCLEKSSSSVLQTHLLHQGRRRQDGQGLNKVHISCYDWQQPPREKVFCLAAKSDFCHCLGECDYEGPMPCGGPACSLV